MIPWTHSESSFDKLFVDVCQSFESVMVNLVLIKHSPMCVCHLSQSQFHY